MHEAEKILEKLPSVKIGLDDHYGKQTVLNALNQALSMSGVIESLPQDNFCKVCNLPTDGEKCYSKRCPV